MIDYTQFMKENMGKVLAKLPPKERADMNRLVQNISNTLGSVSSVIDIDKKTPDIDKFCEGLIVDVHKAHADFTEGLNKTVNEHDKMQDKYVDNSKK